VDSLRGAAELRQIAQRVGGDPYRVLGSAAGELTNGPVVVVLDQNWADAESVPKRQSLGPIRQLQRTNFKFYLGQWESSPR
jgi:hypothetical protein